MWNRWSGRSQNWYGIPRGWGWDDMTARALPHWKIPGVGIPIFGALLRLYSVCWTSHSMLQLRPGTVYGVQGIGMGMIPGAPVCERAYHIPRPFSPHHRASPIDRETWDVSHRRFGWPNPARSPSWPWWSMSSITQTRHTNSSRLAFIQRLDGEITPSVSSFVFCAFPALACSSVWIVSRESGLRTR